MKTEGSGYVYILTNPSFREDWVKIGKSSRPVDIRSKELDNTAVPLPFEIYATMKCSKYDAVEKVIHKQIDLINPAMRVRKGREFFNVHPAKALEIFKVIALMQDDAEIAIYDDGKIVEVIKKDIAPAHELFYVKNKRGANGIGYYDPDSKLFTLKAGSVLSDEVTPSFNAHKLRNKYIDEHVETVRGVMTSKEDVSFTSPSSPSDIILGRSSNGWTEWKNEAGKTLDEVYRKK